MCLRFLFLVFLELENLMVYTVPKTHTNNSIYLYNFYDSNIHVSTDTISFCDNSCYVLDVSAYDSDLYQLVCTTPHAVNQYARRFNHPESPAVNRAHASQITF